MVKGIPEKREIKDAPKCVAGDGTVPLAQESEFEENERQVLREKTALKGKKAMKEKKVMKEVLKEKRH